MNNDKILSIIIRARDEASDVLDGIGSRVDDMSDRFKRAALDVAKVAGVTLVAGLTLASKASWDQVSSVQQATLGLRAYEKDAGKVNVVLADLLKYARSDMGVLFNRKDLFAAAQSLEIMGDRTENLSAHVQIMSRSVGLGLVPWEELEQIIGRVGSTGRLTGDDFDNLTKAGYRLDPALRNTNITWDNLFKSLDKGIPADALAGQANTIQGLGIRLQTAFRGIGDAVLGVDKQTNQFISGGLGDRMTQGIISLTELLKKARPEIEVAMTAILRVVDIVGRGFTALGDAIGYVRGHWEIIRNVMLQLKPIFDIVVAALKFTWSVITEALAPALKDLWDKISSNKKAMEGFALLIGGLFLGAILIAIGAILVIVGVITGLIVAFDSAARAVRWLADRIGEGINSIKGWFNSLPESAWRAFGAVGNAILTALGPIGIVINALIHLRDIASSISGAISSISTGNATGALHALHVPGFASGGYTGSGGMNDIAGIVHKGEYVIPQSGVDQSSGLPKIGGATFNMYGSINLGSADAVDSFFDRLNAQKELGSMGVGV